jgi:hypothetical protein
MIGAIQQGLDVANTALDAAAGEDRRRGAGERARGGFKLSGPRAWFLSLPTMRLFYTLLLGLALTISTATQFAPQVQAIGLLIFILLAVWAAKLRSSLPRLSTMDDSAIEQALNKTAFDEHVQREIDKTRSIFDQQTTRSSLRAFNNSDSDDSSDSEMEFQRAPKIVVIFKTILILLRFVRKMRKSRQRIMDLYHHRSNMAAGRLSMIQATERKRQKSLLQARLGARKGSSQSLMALEEVCGHGMPRGHAQLYHISYHIIHFFFRA